MALSSITVPSLAANLPGKNYAKYLLDSTGGSGTDANYLNDSYGMLPLDGKMLLGFSQYASQITDGKLVSSKPVYLVWVMASLDKKEASAFDKGKNISFAPYSLSASYSSREDALAQYGIIRNAISDAKRGKQGAGLPSTGASLSFKSHSCFDFKATLGGKDGYAGACDLDMSEGSSDYLGILESVD